ncbi:hypothetical protein F4818DRAFT_423721 [Hypoxylon cercidicola]|nr:hypothetical protein F4818DRAFT_423721 [Hypoxylon cercidicola]
MSWSVGLQRARCLIGSLLMMYVRNIATNAAPDYIVRGCLPGHLVASHLSQSDDKPEVVLLEAGSCWTSYWLKP